MSHTPGSGGDFPGGVPWENPADEKAKRRAEARAVVAGIPGPVRAAQSLSVAAWILGSPEWRMAQRVLLYVASPDEVDLSALLSAGLSAGKRVCLPAFDGEHGVYLAREILDPARDLVPGRFRIPEPGPRCRSLPVAELDLMLVPGLAFDRGGGRLGRGKGYYDRLLADKRGPVWGVAFREQLGATLPRESHDQILDGVLTADGWIKRTD